MRGSPLLRALVAFAVLALLSVPVRRLTTAHATREAVATEESPLAQSLRLRLTFTHIPQELRVLHLGESVLRETPAAAELERDLKLEFPAEGVDLEFQIDWPDDMLGALRIRATDPNGGEHERTVWGRGRTEQVISFP